MKKMGFSLLTMAVAGLLAAGCQGVLGGKGQQQVTKYDQQAKKLLAQMTLDEKIGQMIQAETSGLEDPSDVEKYYLGSVLAGGGADPKTGNDPESWTAQFEDMMAHSLNTRLRIPLLFGIDAVHGHNNVVGTTIFPHNIGLGCANNAALVEDCARATAVEMRATGIHWTFAPCVTVPQDERWGRTYEGFSENPEIAGNLGAAAVRGLQGKGLADDESVLACVKHYAGDGGTAFGSAKAGKGLDQGDTRCDEATFRKVHLASYDQSIAEGAGSIMPSYSSWNGLKCSANKFLLTDVLRGEKGFEGFLISDYEAIKQIDPDFKKSIAISVNAGMDMAMEPTKYREFFNLLKELVNEGTVPMSRIDDAVTRILRVKFAMGLMDKNYNYKVDRKLHDNIGSEEHRAIARQAVRESLVLLKNDKKVLPLDKNAARIHITGSAADDLGMQCGGWTVEWQGKKGDVTSGVTVLGASMLAIGDKTELTRSTDGSGAEGADVCVVVIGEIPYAEGDGDRADLSLSPDDIAAFRKAKASGVPVVVVLFSGRPMIINDILADADAVVAAWLPGTEGQGITDVLFGDYKPTGKLSFTWPKDMAQIPVNLGDGKTDPLFPYGYGLSY